MNRVSQTTGAIPPDSAETSVESTTAPPAGAAVPPTSTKPVALPDPRARQVIEQATSAEPAPAPPRQVVLGLNDGDRRVVAVLIALALLLMLVHWYRLMHVRPAPIEVLHPEGYRFQLDVNTATWVEWMQLDDVGETLARRIVEDRRLNGPFASVDDVERVPGIGPKTMLALRPYLVCTPHTDEPAKTDSAGTHPPATSQTFGPSQ